MTGIRLEQRLFEDFFRATLPRLAAHLDASGMPLSIVTTNWFMCVYTSSSAHPEGDPPLGSHP